jgi:hypothetical protein
MADKKDGFGVVAMEEASAQTAPITLTAGPRLRPEFEDAKPVCSRGFREAQVHAAQQHGTHRHSRGTRH